ELGFKYTSNSSRLFLDGTEPVRLAWGCWEMPVYYMDNLDLTMAKFWPNRNHQPMSREVLLQALAGSSLYVFDFHPLHISLNTPTLEYYLRHADALKAGKSPFTLRFEGYGVGTFFQDFCELMIARRAKSVPLIDALHVWTNDESRSSRAA